jgi:hypothetical protein
MFEAYLNGNGVGSSSCLGVALEWEHAVFSQIYWQIEQVLAVFPSEQSAFSLANHNSPPELNL